MLKLKVYILSLIITLLAGCGIRMQQKSLIDEWGGSYNSTTASVFQEKEIYNDQSTDIWGLEKTECKYFKQIDTVSFKGSSCLSISWNKIGACPWIGFGIGWNGYLAKDMNDIMQTGSIDFYVRSVKGQHHIPTLIFLLEDYSGIQTASLLKAKYFERYPIDENWQRVSIPLRTFLQAQKPLSDFSNIKSLNIECQGSGDILIDKIEIGTATQTASIEQKFGKVTAGSFPIYIFKDSLPYAWGFGEYKGKNIHLTSDNKAEGSQSIHLKWDSSEMGNQLKQVGINWERWQAISLPDSINSYELQFYLYINKPKAFEQLKMGFESYNGRSVLNAIKPDYYASSMIIPNTWQLIKIPFSEFKFKESRFDTERFKQFLIEFEGTGEVWLDEITIQQK
jgi:hypothetical protein